MFLNVYKLTSDNPDMVSSSQHQPIVLADPWQLEAAGPEGKKVEGCNTGRLHNWKETGGLKDLLGTPLQTNWPPVEL